MENFSQPCDEKKQDEEGQGVFGTLGRRVKEMMQSDEDYIGGRDMALFQAAGFSVKEIEWIATVKKKSSLIKGKSRGSSIITAYDLIRMQAMIGKDFEKSRKFQEHGGVDYSDKTVEYLDDVLARIGHKYEIWNAEYEEALAEAKRSFGEKVSIQMVEKKMIEIADRRYGRIDDYEMRVCSCYVRWKLTSSPDEKARLLTDWLSVVHLGGNREVLDLFGGIPGEEEAKTFKQSSDAKDDFLKRLNNLGNKR